MNPLFLDTSYIIEYLRGNSLSNLDRVQVAVREKSVYYNGIVLTELLSGVHSKKQGEKIEDILSGITYLPLKYPDFKKAGEIRNKLFKKGFSISTPDSLIVSHIMVYQLTFITLDSFFMKVSDLVGIDVEIPTH